MKCLSALMLAGLAAFAGTTAHAEPSTRPSEYRPDLAVEWIYRQQLDDVYFTDWFARLEASDSGWRDIYFETSDKYVNKGVIRLSCTDPEADIVLTLYDTGKYGSADDRRQVTVPYGDRRVWADGNYEPLFGETPSFEIYDTALARFCK